MLNQIYLNRNRDNRGLPVLLFLFILLFLRDLIISRILVINAVWTWEEKNDTALTASESNVSSCLKLELSMTTEFFSLVSDTKHYICPVFFWLSWSFNAITLKLPIFFIPPKLEGFMRETEYNCLPLSG